MKIDNKGYLVVELVVSFAISLTVTLFLLSTIFELKRKNDDISLETKMLTNQAVIMKEIQDDLTADNLDITGINVCDNGNYCFNFIFTGGITKQLAINTNNRTIEYGTEERPFKKRLPDEGEFGNISIRKEKITAEDNWKNSMIIIEIPIVVKKTGEHYDVKCLYQYDEAFNNVLITGDMVQIDYS